MFVGNFFPSGGGSSHHHRINNNTIMGRTRSTTTNQINYSSKKTKFLLPIFQTLLFFFILLQFFQSFTLVHSLTFSKRFLGHNCTASTYLRDCGEELICDVKIGQCTFCTNSTQCSSTFGSLKQCRRSILSGVSSSDSSNLNSKALSGQQDGGICYHKDLFPQFSYLDAIATVLSFFGSVLSTMSGIGGGGLIVPIMETAGQFPPQMAVGISKTMIFGASISNFIALSMKRHPHADRPIINYDVTLLLQPTTLVGVLVGVLVNSMAPNWLIVLLSAIILTIVSLTTFVKAIRMYRAENAAKLSSSRMSSANYHQISDSNGDGDEHSNRQSTLAESDDESETFDKPKKNDTHHQLETSLLGEEELEQMEQDNIEKEEKKQCARKLIHDEKTTPYTKLFILVLCWIIVLVLTIIRGGHGAPSVFHIPHCSVWHWVLFALMFPIMIGISTMVGFYLVRKHREREALVSYGYRFVVGDPRWGIGTVILYPFLSALSGVIAGMLGVGGGMIKSPMLMYLGLDPLVASATASFMMLFTSSISSIQFMILGTLPFDYALWYFIFGLFAGMVGQILLYFVFEKRRRSIIVFIVAMIIFVSTLCMTGFGIYNAVIMLQNNMYMGFHSMC